MKITINKALPIALHAQIVGAIEYGIIIGSFRHETELPSVRVLGRELGVAPLTVSNAYQVLKNRGLIETIKGKGTYIAKEPVEISRELKIENLRARFLQLTEEAEYLGFNSSFFMDLLKNDEGNPQISAYFSMAMIGSSHRINLSYLEVIRGVLPVNQRIDSYTFEEFQVLAQDKIDAYPFYLTIPGGVPLVRQRIKPSVPVFAPYVVPSEVTQVQLSTLTADQSVLLVAQDQAFLTGMFDCVTQFAPQVKNVNMLTLDHPKFSRMVKKYKTVIYSTTSYEDFQRLGLLGYGFEFHHMPDIRYLQEILEPEYRQFCQKYRQQLAQRECEQV